MPRAFLFRIPSKHQRGKSQPQTFPEFVEQVRDAAKNKKRQPGSRGPVECLTRDKETLVKRLHPPRRQCIETARSTGQRCKSWAIRGATRCKEHGGIRENPYSEAAIQAYERGDVEAYIARRAAQDEMKKYPREVRDEVRAFMEGEGMRALPERMIEGVKAAMIEDGGKAWRRWCATIKDAASRQHRKPPGSKSNPNTDKSQ